MTQTCKWLTVLVHAQFRLTMTRILTHGCENWSLNRTDERKPEGAEMNFKVCF